MNIIEYLSPSQKKALHYKNLKKDDVLFRENDICEYIGIVIEGQLSIVTYLKDGKEIVYNILYEDDIFGNNLIFSSEPYYKGNIITNVSTKIALISRDDLIKILKTNTKFMFEYLKIQSDFSKQLNNKIKMLSMDSAIERFYFYMHENKGSIEYSSVSELAKSLYLKRETLSRLLSKLIKQKKIKKTNDSIKLL